MWVRMIDNGFVDDRLSANSRMTNGIYTTIINLHSTFLMLYAHYAMLCTRYLWLVGQQASGRSGPQLAYHHHTRCDMQGGHRGHEQQRLRYGPGAVRGRWSEL